MVAGETNDDYNDNTSALRTALHWQWSWKYIDAIAYIKFYKNIIVPKRIFSLGGGVGVREEWTQNNWCNVPAKRLGPATGILLSIVLSIYSKMGNYHLHLIKIEASQNFDIRKTSTLHRYVHERRIFTIYLNLQTWFDFYRNETQMWKW